MLQGPASGQKGGHPPKSPALLLALASLLFFAAAVGRWAAAFDGTQAEGFPQTTTIEKKLLDLVNRERESRLLGPLRLSSDLVSLAREHSEEMARLGILRHASEDGLTLTERLAKAEILFRANGENVARSESSMAELIHESFMNSPEHRESILNPVYDEIGIGIARNSRGVYFVTQDFVQSFELRSGEDIRDILLGQVNSFRSTESLPPLDLEEEVNEIAEGYSRNRAAGLKMKAVPRELGAAKIAFTQGPDLDKIGESLIGEIAAGYSLAGIGSSFARTPEYPGGAYYVSSIFLPVDEHRALGAAEWGGVVFGAVNEERRGKALEPLVLDGGLSRIAGGLIRGSRAGRAPRGAYAVVYETPDLEALPDVVLNKVRDGHYQRIGVAVGLSEGKALARIYIVGILLGE